jgi:hypothetical protein
VSGPNGTAVSVGSAETHTGRQEMGAISVVR